MHSRQQSRLDPSPFIVRTVIGFRHSIAGQPPKQAASCSVRSAIVVFPEIAIFILIVHENAARLLLRPHRRALRDVPDLSSAPISAAKDGDLSVRSFQYVCLIQGEPPVAATGAVDIRPKTASTF